MNKYLEIKNDLFFNIQQIKSQSIKEKTVELNVHHTFVIDCSGSMYDVLPNIRKDLHNKISTTLQPKDSITLIWFSGKGECGVILENYKINSTINLEKVRELINRHLTPKGLTAFKDPIIEFSNVIDRINEPNMLHTFFFITDGHDNQYSENEILKAIESVKSKVSGATIIEYGWYCNRELLGKMAENIGGVHVFGEDFQDYEPYISKEFSSSFSSKRKYVKLDKTPLLDIAFEIKDGDIIVYKINENNEIFINVDENKDTNILYLTDYVLKDDYQFLGGDDYMSRQYLSGDYKNNEIISYLYASLFVFSRKNDYNIVSNVLKFTGDAFLIKEKANTFGTQKITELEAKFVECATDVSKMYSDGYNPDLEPSEDAYCVLNMIDDLISDENNLWYPRHPEFSYKRIGSKTKTKDREISEKEKSEVELLLNEGKLNELQSKIDELKTNVAELKFIFNEENPPSPFYNLTWNESRANLSVLVEYKGYVELPDNEFSIPNKLDTKIMRNYTIIKDGIINTYRLPVSLSEETFNKLQSNDLLKGETYESGKIYILDFSLLPVINRSMIKTLCAEDLFKGEYELLKTQAWNTTINHLKKRFFNNASKGFKDTYGPEAEAWLSTFGLKDYGFNPPSTIEKQNEEIEVNILEIKIDKLTLPNTKADFEKIEQKIKANIDLTPREALLEKPIKEFNKFQELIKDVSDKDKMIETWLYDKSKVVRRDKSALMNTISKLKFMTIIGKTWFKEFESREQKEMTLRLDEQEIKFRVEDKLKTIKL